MSVTLIMEVVIKFALILWVVMNAVVHLDTS